MAFTLENFDLSNLLGSDLDAFTQSAANLKNPHNNVDYDSFHDFLSPHQGGESIDSDLPYSWFDYNRNTPQIKTEPMDEIVPVESLPPSMFFQPPAALSNPSIHPHGSEEQVEKEQSEQPEQEQQQQHQHHDQHVELDSAYASASDDDSDATTKPTPKRSSRKNAGGSKSKQKALSPQIKRKRSVSPAGSTSSRRSSVMDAELENIELPKIQKTAHSSQFVPPDTSNLPKKEARLLKNRAAAFLSRQRKREAFELLEDKVNEIEKEKDALRMERDEAFAGERRALDQLKALQMRLDGERMQQ
ncbi:hypothetical protein E3P89_03565 [Wallemia ichthyophaga]|uniref:BZIP domain-containing protein n=2 Tax=Wallemia ichthyophaga TaxID=245174 RepID=A0A4T0GDX7_WALIC|nr:uncharacterized protein J056_002711 [Wallemia ichthyophaga EXF-994]TIA69297.1 hypothetical protein E3P91_03678 [Wallemia ichthyophaga]EOQ98945.1 hypothetical protein J056_002711 [Wallemia ichthyophaga EXF-994]TIA81022.1 hypothetical protein E3P98_02284 [Wallemia ichthyophaga]TIA90234.1 hypothetical protein E3P97_02605 [Wallemia ichthyophaga]TIA94867.1 hypothetical protein E3P96_03994 [Wallemia ichthyophaga]